MLVAVSFVGAPQGDCVITVEAEPTHPFASVTVAEYVPAPTTIEEVIAPVLQIKVNGEIPVGTQLMVTVPDAQTELPGLIASVTTGGDVIEIFEPLSALVTAGSELTILIL